MISLELARQLRAAGIHWEPTPGDKFVLPDRGMDDEVFVLSHMVVDVHDFPSGRVIGFNGTVEWALDSVELEAALWLPNEEQLRELLGDAFVQLVRINGSYSVTLDVRGRQVEIVDENPADAYGRAVRHVMTGE